MTGVHAINIDPGCSVHTRFFTIPAHFIGYSSLSIKGSFEPSINVTRISFDICNHSTNHLYSFKAIESVLAEASNHSKVPGYEMSINHLQAQLQQTQNDLHHAKLSGDQMCNVNIHLVLNLAVSTGSIIILLVLLILCVKFIKKR